MQSHYCPPSLALRCPVLRPLNGHLQGLSVLHIQGEREGKLPAGSTASTSMSDVTPWPLPIPSYSSALPVLAAASTMSRPESFAPHHYLAHSEHSLCVGVLIRPGLHLSPRPLPRQTTWEARSPGNIEEQREKVRRTEEKHFFP